jgi:hypothetical protein
VRKRGRADLQAWPLIVTSSGNPWESEIIDNNVSSAERSLWSRSLTTQHCPRLHRRLQPDQRPSAPSFLHASGTELESKLRLIMRPRVILRRNPRGRLEVGGGMWWRETRCGGNAPPSGITRGARDEQGGFSIKR